MTAMTMPPLQINMKEGLVYRRDSESGRHGMPRRGLTSARLGWCDDISSRVIPVLSGATDREGWKRKMKRGAVEVLKREGEGDGDERGARKKRKVDVNLQEIEFDIKQMRKLSLVTAAADGKSCISTVGFLSVSKLLLLVLDKVVPTMAVLRHDVQQNIKRLEDFYLLDPSLYSDLVEILKREADEGTARKQQSCSRAFVWLTRSMDFSVALSERLKKDPESSLEQAVEGAYSEILKPWHGWIASAAYKIALKLLPDRKTFMDLLNGKENLDLSDEDISSLLSQIQPFLSSIHNHLVTFKLERLMSN